MKQALILLAVVTVFSLFYLVMYNVLSSGAFFPRPTFYRNLLDYIYNFIPILALTVSNYFIIFRLWNNTVIEKHLPVKIIADFIVGFAVLLIVNMLYIAIAKALHLNPRVGWPGTVLCNTLLILGIEVAYYIKRSKEAIQKAEYAKREALQYQYDSLKAQVNPHFLFNSLNIQLSLILSDQKRAYQYTIALSNIYRYILSIQNKSRVLLSEELDFLRAYVSILEMRYSHHFKVEFHGEENCNMQQIVPFTMQLLIENVTKHNVISKEHPMEVRIDIGENSVVVSNPIKPKYSESAGGIGHKYIAQQYRSQGKAFRIINDGNTFTAIIPYL